MKNFKIKGWIIADAVVTVLALWGIGSYNSLVGMDEEVNGKWANVETQYQRRSDLIPNLVNTVKGYATHEKQTLEAVMQARSQATQVKIDPSNCTPQKLAAYQKAQGDVTTALGKLLAILENYPQLKANETSSNCSRSSKAQRTALMWRVRTLTMWQRSITRPSASSRKTLSPACAALRSTTISRLKQEQRRLLKWNFNACRKKC